MGIDIPVGGSGGQGDAPKAKGQPYEVLLAQLAFSNPMELPKIVESNLLTLDDSFFACKSEYARSSQSSALIRGRAVMDSKITGTNDKEEKETLTLLKDAVVDLKKTILNASQAPALPFAHAHPS